MHHKEPIKFCHKWTLRKMHISNPSLTLDLAKVGHFLMLYHTDCFEPPFYLL